MARTFPAKTPSQYLGIEDEFLAFCFDDAVAHFGGLMDQELDKAPGKTPEERSANRQMILRRIIEGKELFAEPPRRS